VPGVVEAPSRPGRPFRVRPTAGAGREMAPIRALSVVSPACCPHGVPDGTPARVHVVVLAVVRNLVHRSPLFVFPPPACQDPLGGGGGVPDPASWAAAAPISRSCPVLRRARPAGRGCGSRGVDNLRPRARPDGFRSINGPPRAGTRDSELRRRAPFSTCLWTHRARGIYGQPSPAHHLRV